MKMKPQVWQRCAFGGGLYSTPKTWLSKVTPCPGCHSVASTFSRRNVLEEHNRKHDCSIYNHLFVVSRSFTVVGKAEFPATVTAAGGRKSLKRSASCFPCGKHFPHNALWKLLGLGVISYWHANVFRADGGVLPGSQLSSFGCILCSALDPQAPGTSGLEAMRGQRRGTDTDGSQCII